MYVVGFLFTLCTAALSPYVFQQGWEWFVVPLGVPAITYWQAMGIRALVFGFMHRPQSLADKQAEEQQTDRQKEVRLVTLALTGLLATLITWGVLALARWIPT